LAAIAGDRRPPNRGGSPTRVGWAGGHGDNPSEENPGGHAEAVEVVFDPERISYRDLLEYFFQVHRADLDEHLVGSRDDIADRLLGRFAQFLDRATDVAAWAKLTMNSRFGLEYISSTGALRYYYPDFVIRLTDGACLIVETKGLEDTQVALKDRRARRWCRDATELSGREWGYEKVLERPCDAYIGDTVKGLRRFLAVRGGRQDQEA
jgi:Peptide methionine sulfoxide reductase